MTVRGYLMSPGLPVDPGAAPVSNAYRWATVTDNNPLEIQLDGDSLPLATVPDCLVDPLMLGVGNRVWVQLYGRKVIVHGAAGGGTGPHTLANEALARVAPASGGTTSSGSWTDWPNVDGPCEATLVKRLATSLVVVDVIASGWAQSPGEVQYGVRVDATTDNLVVSTWHNTTLDHRAWPGRIVLPGLAAGSHTFRLRVKTGGETIEFDAHDQFLVGVREVAAP